MAIILIAVVLAVITGLNYFGKPISRTMWLVLFILSAVALVLVMFGHFYFFRPCGSPQLLPKIFPSEQGPPPTNPQMARITHPHPETDRRFAILTSRGGI